MSAVIANRSQPPGAAAARPSQGLSALLRNTQALDPLTPVDSVADSMLDSRYAGLLSLPVVRGDEPIGTISRYEMRRVFLMRFGRELYGHRAIETLANRNALILAIDTPIDEAARLIAERIQSPITDDFILVDSGGRYLGTGVVLDVLRAMDASLAERSSELERAYARLKSSQLQLVQSEKMASLGQMVAGLVHEINTPLGYVRNNVEMTRNTLGDAGRLLGAYEAIHRSLFEESVEPPADLPDRLAEAAELRRRVDESALIDIGELLDDSLHGLGQIAELVDNLKNFSRLDQGLLQKADLNQLVASALRIVQHVMRNGAKRQPHLVIARNARHARRLAQRLAPGPCHFGGQGFDHGAGGPVLKDTVRAQRHPAQPARCIRQGAGARIGGAGLQRGAPFRLVRRLGAGRARTKGGAGHSHCKLGRTLSHAIPPGRR